MGARSLKLCVKFEGIRDIFWVGRLPRHRRSGGMDAVSPSCASGTRGIVNLWRIKGSHLDRWEPNKKRDGMEVC